MNGQLELIESLVRQGGPSQGDYPALDAWISNTCRLVETGQLCRDDVAAIRAAFGEAFSPETIQGFALAKPHGYAGDFEIIDRIYREFVTPVPHLTSWDVYWQRHAAPRAVRNRKRYFLQLLHSRADCHSRPLLVLNVASGPGRDMLEYFQSEGASPTRFHCVEQDPLAIAHASALCQPFLPYVKFTRTDVLRFRPREQYDLVWSGGLFDYFDDRLFRAVLRRLLPAVAVGGELVIGNFAPNNPSRYWMRLCEWLLHYRSAEQLVALAESCGVSTSSISVGMEPEGINLFLHIHREETLAYPP